MRTILILLGLLAVSYLCYAFRWDLLVGMVYFAGFTLVALVAFFYRDPRRKDVNLADE
jgi:hypothetical protein